MEKWWANRSMDDNADAIAALGLENEVAALDEVGLAIVPQSKLRLDDDFFATLKRRLLEVAESLSACRSARANLRFLWQVCQEKSARSPSRTYSTRMRSSAACSRIR
jgi:hypothetical protein